MDMDTAGSVLAELLLPIVLAVGTGLGAWVATHMPGPLKDWMASGTHARDVQLLVGAMLRRAMAVSSGQHLTTTPALDLASYARTALPEVVAKLNPTDEALRTMAQAAIAQAASALAADRTAAAAAAAPARPQVPGGGNVA
jgi:hypothetical protein